MQKLHGIFVLLVLLSGTFSTNLAYADGPVITVDPLEITLELNSEAPDLLDGVTTDDGSEVTPTGTVDMTKTGDYDIIYDSTDGVNDAEPVTRTYHVTDTAAPVITVDPLEITLELNSEAPDLLDGVTTDDGSEVTPTGTVDMTKTGDYDIIYDSTDGVNDAEPVTRTYHVTDTAAPVITVDPLEITLELNSEAPDLLDGVTTDDGSEVTPTGTVDMTKTGDYDIIYDSTDGVNDAEPVTRTYHVTDTAAPVITVDPLEITLELNSEAPDLLDGVTTDDGSEVTPTGTVDMTKTGDYDIIYDSTDGVNDAEPVTRTYHVTDTAAPVITVDPLEITLELNSEAPDLLDGVTTDDGSEVTPTGTVDMTKTGDYDIIYDSTDGVNDAEPVTRTYHVTDTAAPVITVDPLEITLELNSEAPDLLDGVTTDDGSEVTPTGTVDMTKTGDYDIIYDSTDGVNDAEPVTRTYHVTDTAAPVITVDPLEITLELNSEAPDLLDGVTTDDGSEVTPTGTVDMTKTGDYDIIYDSTDGVNDAEPVTRTYHVILPDSKSAQMGIVVDYLTGLKDTTDDKTDKKLDKIIKKINKAMDSKYWDESGTELTSKKGKKVFDESKKAVKDMSKISKKSDVVYPEIASSIGLLVGIAHELATDAINDAQAHAGDKKADKEIKKSIKEMNKAQKELEKGKPDKAIDKYKKAWEHAQKALKKVKDPKDKKK